MANFNAQTKDEFRGVSKDPAPGTKTPEVEVKNFGFSGDSGSALHREFTYATRKHTLTEILAPGYFNAARDFGVKIWDVIKCTIGNDPGTALEVKLRVIEVPSERGFPLMVSKGQVEHFVPVRHDGTGGETKAA